MAPTRRAILSAGAVSLAGCLAPSDSQSRVTCPARVSGGDGRLGFVGDVMLGRSVTDRWESADPEGVWGSTLSRLRALDGLFLNLECCVSDRGERWPGKTYYFRAPPDFAVPALSAADATFASLANNHTLDFGAVALSDTRDHLDRAGVAHAGAGPDADAAYAPAIFEAGGLTVAVLALTDQWQPYRAESNTPGTAYIPLTQADPSTRHIVGDALETATARDPDLVLASLHWGPNWRTEPADHRRRFARWLVDQGVDLVHGHSAHVVQGIETYRGRPIIYDAGDFVDDYIHRDDVHNKRSFLFELVVSGGRLDALDLVPIEISDERATLADKEVAAWLRETMGERSAAFGTTVERRGDGLRIPLSC